MTARIAISNDVYNMPRVDLDRLLRNQGYKALGSPPEKTPADVEYMVEAHEATRGLWYYRCTFGGEA